MIKVLVADDHVVVRKGLKLLLGMTGDMEVAGEAADGNAVLQALRAGSFDLLLLDLTMPAPSGVELIELVYAEFPGLPILVLSMRKELHVAKRVLHMGVSGYVTKGCNEELLIAAIRKVAGGGRFIDPAITELLLDDDASSSTSIESLSERELQIMRMVAKGKAIVEIADELGISMKSVSTYKSRVMKKMNFRSNSELAIYAAEFGLIPE